MKLRLLDTMICDVCLGGLTLPPTKFLKWRRAFLKGLLWAPKKSPDGEGGGSPCASLCLLRVSSKVLSREGDKGVGEGVEGSWNIWHNQFNWILKHL